jgi:2-amino-4-hydroxy-6-hydroxymethyldihydropteridine diphosphokinase
MILLGLGSNLSSTFGDRFENIDISISYLESYQIKLVKKSSFYQTPSYPDITNPKFINVVIEVSTDLLPEDLASVLIYIEEKLERKRNKKNEPRTCDIDILDYNGKIMNFNYKKLNFIVPHEKLIYRNFVLVPLEEIMPNWTHPKTKEKISALIVKLSEKNRKSILKVKKN